MSEEENKELQHAAGGEQNETEKAEKSSENQKPESAGPVTAEQNKATEDNPGPPPEKNPKPSAVKKAKAAGENQEDSGEEAAAETPGEAPGTSHEDTKQGSPGTQDSGDDADKEIDESNAEDSENERRHQIPFLDYHSMSMENLVGELQRLLRKEKVQAIRRHVDSIKREFDQKFREFLEQKKEEFVERGGNDSDFQYNSVTKRQFNELYGEYREKRNQYYKNLERSLKENLQRRLDIIEELKGLVNVEEDMTTTYNTFKALQEKWRHAGPVPRTQYNDVWRTYQHHVEIFYDFLHLNRELRDLDFKHNLEEKEKLIERAEALSEEADINKAFRELQTLHKLWKEELGPVAKDQRDAIWERFSAATKAVHKRRQGHFQELEKRYEENLETKRELIAKIEAIASNVADNHRGIQKQIKEVEALREAFFKAGKVPQNANENTWSSFKGAVRKFNRTKNAYYKNLKKEQQENLEKKRALLERAEALKDSEDWKAVTPEMKRIQKEWKTIGHVPRRQSDKIWKAFKKACNHYFDRLHARRNAASAEERKHQELKEVILDKLRKFELTGKREADLSTIQGFLKEWKMVGELPRKKRHLEGKFKKIIDALYRKLGVSKQEADLLKYGDKIKQLSGEEDVRAIEEERQFIRKKIAENKGQIRQLENNLEFFSDPSEDNPLVKDVIESIERQREALESWESKLKKLNILRNTLEKEEAASQEESEAAGTENATKDTGETK